MDANKSEHQGERVGEGHRDPHSEMLYVSSKIGNEMNNNESIDEEDVAISKRRCFHP